MSGTRVSINGIDLYHDVHGTGRPLVVLHGGAPARRERRRCAPIRGSGCVRMVTQRGKAQPLTGSRSYRMAA